MLTTVTATDELTVRARRLLEREAGCVSGLPVLTNIGIVLPEPGFHEALHEVTRRTETPPKRRSRT
jgi:glutamate-1-semialdehyde 2,1-aminomutase